jgi:uncharacterized protein YlxW (UPF0749 family)
MGRNPQSERSKRKTALEEYQIECCKLSEEVKHLQAKVFDLETERDYWKSETKTLRNGIVDAIVNIIK